MDNDTKEILTKLTELSREQTQRVGRIERTLGTLIAWQYREFGENGVKQLLEMLEPPKGE